MDRDQLNGHAREIKGILIETWGRLTDDPWLKIAGRRHRLIGRLQAARAEYRQIVAKTERARQRSK